LVWAAPESTAITDQSSRKELEMDDNDIHRRIEELVAEEHRLWEDEAKGGAVDGDRTRLEEVKVTLDQFWDLLRQRRALRDAGLDPEAAQTRDENTVERYWQ
jgi:hypothetical protein